MPFSSLFKEAASYEAQPGQNLGDYCFQKLCELWKLDIDIPDKYQLNIAIGGIPDNTVAHTVRSAQHDDNPNALYAFINIVDDMPSQGQESTGTTEKGRLPMLSGRLRCNKSGKEGDTSKRINILDRVKPVENLCEISACVNGKRMDSLVDTDSVCTVMHSSVARELGIATKVIADALLRMFARQTVVANMVARVTIAIQNAKADVDSFVVPDEYTRHPVIVGRNFILQDHVVTIKHGNRLIFNEIPTFGLEQIATTRHVWKERV